MPQFKRGNMFREGIGQILVTTNSFLRKNGTLVMGRGAALEATRIYPGIDYYFGTIIQERCGHLGEYNIIMPGYSNIGAFQVKYAFMAKADTGLIARSCVKLIEVAASYNGIVNLNYPGIGNGGLSKDLVQPLLERLPKNVFIWEWR